MKEKILKWCGFEIFEFEEKYWGGMMNYYVTPDGGISLDNPPLDMNFFFEYVVPKLARWEIEMGSTKDGSTFVTICEENQLYPSGGKNPDPNLAWQEALEKLIEGE